MLRSEAALTALGHLDELLVRWKKHVLGVSVIWVELCCFSLTLVLGPCLRYSVYIHKGWFQGFTSEDTTSRLVQRSRNMPAERFDASLVCW